MPHDVYETLTMGQIRVMSKQIMANRKIELAENARVQNASMVDAICKTFGKESEYLNNFIDANLSDGTTEQRAPSQDAQVLAAELESRRMQPVDTDGWETFD